MSWDAETHAKLQSQVAFHEQMHAAGHTHMSHGFFDVGQVRAALDEIERLLAEQARLEAKVEELEERLDMAI